MGFHVIERMAERCPMIDAEQMFEAVNEYMIDGYHDAIEKVMPAREGADILRYNQNGVVTYPIIDTTSGTVITVYTQAFVSGLKARTKFKAKLKSRKCWKGKT